MKLSQLIPRFSLRTLAIFLVLATSAAGTWHRRSAYYFAGYIESTEWRPAKTSAQSDPRLPSVSFSGDGERFVTADCYGKVRVWNSYDLHPLAEMDGTEEAAEAQLSADGRIVFSTLYRDGTPPQLLAVSDARSGKLLATKLGDFRELTPSLDGKLVAYTEGGPHVWDWAADRTVSFDASPWNALYFGWSLDAKLLGTYYSSIGLLISDPSRPASESERVLERPGKFIPEVAGMAFSPNGQWLAVTVNGRTTLRNLESGRSDLVADDGGHFCLATDGHHVLLKNLIDNTVSCYARGLPGKLWAEKAPEFDAVIQLSQWRLVAWSRYNGYTETYVRDIDTGDVLTTVVTGQARFLPWISPDLRTLISAAKRPYGSLEVWKMRRPPWWWGIFYLWELWLAAAFAGLFAWSVWRDRKGLSG